MSDVKDPQPKGAKLRLRFSAGRLGKSPEVQAHTAAGKSEIKKVFEALDEKSRAKKAGPTF